MPILRGLFAPVLVLLIGRSASAQEAKGWLDADVQDGTKAEANTLGWDSQHGAKLGVVAAGSPADNAGLKTGEIIELADGVEVETSSAFEKTIAANSLGSAIHLRVLSGGGGRRVGVMLVDRPTNQAAQDQGGPLLMLDTGGHKGALPSRRTASS